MPGRSEHLVNRTGPVGSVRVDDDALTLALSFVAAPQREALTSLFALDTRLRSIAESTSQAMIGQLRLAWWRDALVRLDDAPPPAEPLLQRIATDCLSAGLTGGALSEVVDGWEAFVVEPDDIDTFAERRGAVLFRLVGTMLARNLTVKAIPSFVSDAGRAWALYDGSQLVSDPATRTVMTDRAKTVAVRAFAKTWSANLRPLGILLLLVRSEIDPRRSRLSDLLRLIRFRLIGR